MDLISCEQLIRLAGLQRTPENFKKIYNAINADLCEDSLDVFLKKIESSSVEEIINKGSEIISSLSVSVSAPSQAPVQVEETKPEVKEEEEEVPEVSLFGDDDDFF
ncbi:60s ribosomal protein p2 [Vairimorpha apis BRL 01]|uniref:60s ribosomal protein p2 n=1 Tax=Vairimorpha apis BRL 01 TaxID=1037528 RepID=T0KZS3_9MICR|nr:60s ribosomal protein p2 [Vairimorpha apis BRL 01]